MNLFVFSGMLRFHLLFVHKQCFVLKQKQWTNRPPLLRWILYISAKKTKHRTFYRYKRVKVTIFSDVIISNTILLISLTQRDNME